MLKLKLNFMIPHKGIRNNSYVRVVIKRGPTRICWWSLAWWFRFDAPSLVELIIDTRDTQSIMAHPQQIDNNFFWSDNTVLTLRGLISNSAERSQRRGRTNARCWAHQCASLEYIFPWPDVAATTKASSRPCPFSPMKNKGKKENSSPSSLFHGHQVGPFPLLLGDRNSVE